MDEMGDIANAFAIPDLWKTSSLANLDEELKTDPVALRLEPLGAQNCTLP